MAALNSSVPPAAQDYGGDEISAIVLDPGYSTVRAGFAGEDIPKSVIPTYYGVLPTPDAGSDFRNNDNNATNGTSSKLLFGDNAINTPLPGLDVRNPMSKDGLVEDWDVATKVWERSITSRLTRNKPGDPRLNGLNDPDTIDDAIDGVEEEEGPVVDSPLLVTEPAWNPTRAREKSIEIAMENWGVPAFWIAKNGVLSAFASGKHTALIVDVGASNISVTPVHDGMILRKGVTRSNLAGDFLSLQVRRYFSSLNPPIQITPHYLINSKIAVEANQTASATLKTWAKGTEPAPSFRAYQEERVITEFKESVVNVWQGPTKLSSTSPEELNSRSVSRQFELPDGYNQVFSPSERAKIGEGLFDPKAIIPDPVNPNAPPPGHVVPELIRQSISNVDVDIRPLLLGHVIVVGGGSLVTGFVDRLNSELQIMFPSIRSKVHATGIVVERKFTSWIGGSILASLGTFHQMWISRKEYEEHGASIVEKRCK